jgi:hypothetical protein
VVTRQRETGIALVNYGEFGHSMGLSWEKGSPDNFGLITLCGTVIAPGRSGPAGHRPDADGEELRPIRVSR